MGILIEGRLASIRAYRDGAMRRGGGAALFRAPGETPRRPDGN